MNILIVLPPNQPSGGNWTYSGRLQRNLRPYGIDITIKPLDQVSDPDYAAADIIHSYNAYVTGRHIVKDAKRHKKPLVLTMTGTDVNEHLGHPDTTETMTEAVDYAAAIVFLTEEAKERLATLRPSAAAKSQVINLGIDLPQGAGKTRADFGLADDEFLFLLVAGLRPVKRPLDAFEPLQKAYEQLPQVRFVLVGPVLDDKVKAEVDAAFAGSPFARYLGSVPYEEIADLYRAADVVMNTSSSEGLSHALLEAMSIGKPVLASDVPGNRDLIRDGVNGFLYDNGPELTAKAVQLVTDPDMRAKLSQGSLRTIADHYSLERERDTFLAMYRAICNAAPCGAPSN
ncbi:glycosyltransferase involved in cell wall biosynthesis [Tumebacillus sp. BK434]|uniref:glycosyltransferase n=1 Tax=Tumebacillus sp. BK434 TaxID=2512169 RepID=UPI00105143F4|nr:glycosyltransferase [Tumebacillus sp. BK434]TCP53861.1 glycosyltransferase involved in cell wall biosynthesis [Tumebacillus sp. BK434]